MQLSGLTFPLALNQADRSKLTKISIPRGNGVVLPCAIFNGDPLRAESLITDLGNVNFARFVMRAETAAGALLATQQIAAGSLNGALTFEQWTARTAAHVTFALTPAQTNWPARKLYFAFMVDTTTSGPVTLATGAGEITEDGIGEADDPTDPAPDFFLTDSAARGAFLQLANRLSEIAAAGAPAQAAARANLGTTSQEDLDALFTSPDGTVWMQSISNAGVPAWTAAP